MIITGKQLNEQKCRFYKLITEDAKNNMVFKIGENIRPFDCEPTHLHKQYGGSICFTTYDNVFKGIAIMRHVYLCEVRPSDDSTCFIPKSMKMIQTDKLIILNMTHICKFNWDDNDFCLEITKQCGYTLQFIKNQTEEMCINAITNYPDAITNVQNKTKKIWITAIKCKSMIVLSILEKSILLSDVDSTIQISYDEFCMEAVKHDGLYLYFIKDQTDDLCLTAVRQNGHALEYVNDQTKEICIEAVMQNKDAIQYVQNKQKKYV